MSNQWQSNYTSLATKIDRLLGAQWQGINLGQPFCIYKGVPETTFPIILAYHTLALKPKNGLWKKDTKHKSIFQCMTRDLKKCPFVVRLKPKAPSIDTQIDSIIPGASARETSDQGF